MSVEPMTKLFGETPNWFITVNEPGQKKKVIELFGENFDFYNISAIHICLIPLLINNSGSVDNYPKDKADADNKAFELCEKKKIEPVPKDLYRLHSGLFSYLTCPLYRHICDEVGKIGLKKKQQNNQGQRTPENNFYDYDFSQSISVLIESGNTIWGFLNVYINIQDGISRRKKYISSSNLFNGGILSYVRIEGLPPTEPLYIKNYSNSCYMDSVIQCLYWTNGFPTKLLTQKVSNTLEGRITLDDKKKINIADKFIDVIDAYDNSNKVGLQIALQHLKTDYSKMGGINRGQQDAHEFLVNIFDYLETKFPPKLIEDFFTFELEQTLTDKLLERTLTEPVVRVTPQKHNILTVDLPKNQLEVGYETLENQIHKYFMEEVVEYSESLSNRANKAFKIQKSSPNLIIQLKRFDYQFDQPRINQQNAQNHQSKSNNNGQQNQNQNSIPQKGQQNQNSTQVLTAKKKRPGNPEKIKTPIEIPEILNLSEYTTNPEKNLQYELYGFIHHQGESTSSGHYRNFVKVKDSWYLIDALYSKTPVKVTQSNQELYDYYLSRSYLLFYRRVEL